ncbi:MAG: hypothetical protein ACYCZY_01510 [Lacisediminihabitans sp.]
MNPLVVVVVVVVAVGLAILTVWGFVSPRGQWRVLASWSRREPHANEPGSAAVAVQRLVAALGIAVLLAAAGTAYNSYLDTLPKPARSVGPVERMWGSPAPKIVNRVFTAATAAPAQLVNQPILGYQVMDGTRREPGYLFSLEAYAPSAAEFAGGYLGKDPPVGLSALDIADLVVHLRGDKNCLPQQVVLTENKDAVLIAVFYGQPNPPDGSNAAKLGACNPNPPAGQSTSLLLPVGLSAPVGDRTVKTIDGSKVIPVAPRLGG